MHQYVMCALCMRDAVFGISFNVMQLNPLKWKKMKFLGRYYSKTRPWHSKRVIVGRYRAQGLGDNNTPWGLCTQIGVFEFRSIFLHKRKNGKIPENGKKCYIWIGIIQRQDTDPAKG